ncbi:hypothetical protein LTS09_009687 [Friedmanniomyces endolithicus]|nr:hypothetical protein LTS09_009687 [Friedmanniomyces endolithicus]
MADTRTTSDMGITPSIRNHRRRRSHDDADHVEGNIGCIYVTADDAMATAAVLGGLARVGGSPVSPRSVVGSISQTARDPMRFQVIMCFYDNYRFQCGDWKWGNLRKQCEAEYRQGETCGLKTIWTTLPLADKCTMCERIERKQRRFEKHRSDCQRWVVEPQKYRCSIEKAREEMKDLAVEIQRLMAEKHARFNAIGNPRRA